MLSKSVCFFVCFNVMQMKNFHPSVFLTTQCLPISRQILLTLPFEWELYIYWYHLRKYILYLLLTNLKKLLNVRKNLKSANDGSLLNCEWRHAVVVHYHIAEGRLSKSLSIYLIFYAIHAAASKLKTTPCLSYWQLS